MARIRKNILGLLTGKVSEVVFKCRKGTPYISALPSKIKVSQSPKSVFARSQFSFVSPFAKAVTQDFIINTLWERSDVIGETARHKIMSVNIPKFHKREPVEDFSIIPEHNLFNAMLQNAVWEDEQLSIITAPLDLMESELRIPQISAHGIIYLNEPVVADTKPFRFIKVSSGFINFKKGMPLEFIIKINADDQHTIKCYNTRKAILVLVLHDYNNEPVRGSESMVIG